MTDSTYQPDVVQHRQDGNVYVPSGQKIEIEDGGTLSLLAGALTTLPVTVDADGGAITSANLCRVYSTRGATGAVTFTLPAVADNAGKWCLFINAADQNMIVAGPDEGVLTFNDLTADSIAFQTTSEKIGGMFLAICDGTSWCVAPIATETQTVTVASS